MTKRLKNPYIKRAKTTKFDSWCSMNKGIDCLQKKKTKPIKVSSKLLHVHVCRGGMLEVGVGVKG